MGTVAIVGAALGVAVVAGVVYAVKTRTSSASDADSTRSHAHEDTEAETISSAGTAGSAGAAGPASSSTESMGSTNSDDTSESAANADSIVSAESAGSVEAAPREAANEDDPLGAARTDSGNEHKSETGTGESAEAAVIAPARAQPTVEEFESVLRDAWQELWLSRWVLGRRACADLENAIKNARALLATLSLDTAHSPLLSSTVEALEHAEEPLRNLRLAQWQRGLAPTQWRRTNPHRVAITTGRYVSPDPSDGLARLASETYYGLEQARFDIARITPIAGSQTAAILRSLLTRAREQLEKAQHEQLERVQQEQVGQTQVGQAQEQRAPRTEQEPASAQEPAAAQEPAGNTTGTPQSLGMQDLLAAEKHLVNAAWARRAIRLSANYVRARADVNTWADPNHANVEPEQWFKYARIGIRMVNVLCDCAYIYTPFHASASTRKNLGRAQILFTDQVKHVQAGAEPQAHTCETITELVANTLEAIMPAFEPQE
ncbi:hypothetical protein QS713_08110 [Gleimia hominis]|uniref:DUF4439 domain-containing protein n=1 Tax=Gleimia hominis TaxID=595468 RepID=A0ABU3ICM3_9ACTO|nr:hypothetical protein [Gleimia hominis]MDT3768018.1 hypothetical protein [Gleimia hominis]